ncbi:hypothetical protein [Schaedlerella arabinosiphila]|nr:hypothetical protein [Schaedlerella arabinosiphila]
MKQEKVVPKNVYKILKNGIKCGMYSINVPNGIMDASARGAGG